MNQGSVKFRIVCPATETAGQSLQSVERAFQIEFQLRVKAMDQWQIGIELERPLDGLLCGTPEVSRLCCVLGDQALTAAEACPRGGKVRVLAQRLFVQVPRNLPTLGRMSLLIRPQKEFVSRRTLRHVVAQRTGVPVGQRNRQRLDDFPRQLVLKLKDVPRRRLNVIGPEQSCTRKLRQLSSDAEPDSARENRSADDGIHVQLL